MAIHVRPTLPKTLNSPEHGAFMSVLRDSRRGAGLTQAELASRLARPQSYIAKLETGERRMELVEFILLSRAIGRSPARMIEEVEAKVAER